MQTVIDGVLVNYESSGKSSTSSILILHGWGRSLQDWAHVAKELSDMYHVVSVDLPGFGASSFPQNQAWDTYQYAEFVEKLIAKLGLKKPILLGHSLGGRIGIILASKTKSLGKLILVDTAGIEEKSLVVNFKIFLFKSLKFLLPNFLVKNLRKSLGSQDYLQAGNLRQTLAKVVNDNLKHLLPDIKIPTLIIWGEKDDNQAVELAKFVREKIKDSKLRIVWEAGHHPHLEQPKDFMKILKEEL